MKQTTSSSSKIVSYKWMSPTSVRGGSIWWTLRKERQARRICR